MKLISTPDAGSHRVFERRVATSPQGRNVPAGEDWFFSDITRASGREPVLSLAFVRFYLACFLLIGLPERRAVILKLPSAIRRSIRNAASQIQFPNKRKMRSRGRAA